MKKYTLLISALLLSFSFFASSAFASNSLIGYWSNDKIRLNLKAGNQYTYIVKILGVNKVFKGDWSTKGKTLTLNYTLFGKHKKTATYSFAANGDLVLTQDGKTSQLKKKK
jgi:hypothetical protein